MVLQLWTTVYFLQKFRFDLFLVSENNTFQEAGGKLPINLRVYLILVKMKAGVVQLVQHCPVHLKGAGSNPGWACTEAANRCFSHWEYPL